MTAAAQLEGVAKRFGDVIALRGLDLSVEPGEVLALLGPNGAGKTTAIAVLVGLRRPDAGRARIFGRDPRSAEARVAVGTTPQELGFPLVLRVAEVVDFVRRHYPAPLPLDVVLRRFGLEELGNRQVGGLSGGQRRRLGVAIAFAGDPPLVVLDEPTAGLDAASRRAVWDAVRARQEVGGSFLLTTHAVDEADALATRVAVIDRGALVTHGTVAEVKRAATASRIEFRAPAQPVTLPAATVAGGRVSIVSADAGKDIELLVRGGVPLVDLEVRRATLQEALDELGGRE